MAVDRIPRCAGEWIQAAEDKNHLGGVELRDPADDVDLPGTGWDRDHLPAGPFHPSQERGRLSGNRIRADRSTGGPRRDWALHRDHQLPAYANEPRDPPDQHVDLQPPSGALRLLAPLAASRVKTAVAANLVVRP